MAGENIGQLIVEIATEASKLNKGLAEAEAAVNKTTGKITELTNKVGLTMTAMGAAIIGTFALMIKATTDYGEEIYRTSERTGVAVETLSKLKYVAEQTESSFENLAMGFKFLNRNIYDATTGNLKANESFRALGITLRDEVTGNVLKADEVFLKIADKFKGLEDNTAKTALAMQIFGRSGESLIPILNLGSEEITHLSEEAARLGIVLTTENAKAIDQFSDGMKSLKASVGGLWLNIAQLLLPTLEGFIKKVTDFVVTIREWSEAHSQLSKRISEFALGLGILFVILGPLILLFNQFAQAIIFLNALLPGLTLNIGALKVALSTLNIVALATIAVFAGWKLGEWLDNNSKKIENFWNKVNAFLHPFKPKGPVMEFDIGSSLGGKAESTPAATVPGATSGQTTVLDETVNLVERHVQKLKELNEAYIAGKITAMEYYNAVKELHTDGIDAATALQGALYNLANAEDLLIDKEQQKALVIEESARAVENYGRIKAEFANQEQVDYANSLNAATNLLQTLQSMHKTIWQGIFDFVNMGIQKFSSGMSTAISSIILGTKSASQAFKDFGKMMLEAIVEFLVQWAVQALISLALGWLLAKAITSIADTIAAAWLPAAVFASIATMGGAAAAGAAGMAGAAGTGIALLKGMRNLGTGVTAMAEGGFGIVTRPTLFLAGDAGPEAYNFAPVGKNAQGMVNNFYFDNITIKDDRDIEDLAEQLGNDIERKLKRV